MGKDRSTQKITHGVQQTDKTMTDNKTWHCQHGCGETNTTQAGIQTHENNCPQKPKPAPRTAPPFPQPR